MTRRRSLFLGLMIVVVLALAAGCGGGDDENEAATTGAPAAATTEAPPADTGSGETHPGETHAQEDTDGGSLSTVSPAVDLRVALGRLLAEHAALAMFATQKGLAGEKDFEAIAAALDANSVELSEAIGSVYGEDAAKEFLDGDLKWRDHIGFFVDYTVGLAEDDKAAQKQAVDNLTGYVEAISAFFGDATGVSRDALRDAVSAHVTQLKGQIDAYDGESFDKAYSTWREAYHHMFETGDALAGGIAEQQGLELDPATQAASDLRVTLGRLLGEHAALAMTATQTGYAGSKDFEAIAAALDANSVELSEAIGSVYGEDAAKEFLDGDLKWRAHIGFFVDYTVGLAQDDEQAKTEAVDNLMGYTAAFSTFLAEATGLPQEALREGLVAHVEQLKGQIDAYAAGDYEKAYELYREAYHHMWMTGDTLAEAIVVQNPEAFTG